MPQIIKLDLSVERKTALAGYLHKTFGHAVLARRNQVDDKYKRWQDNYAGKPLEAVRTTPFYRASNFVPQLIRMHTDILTARVLGIMFGTKPFWKPRAFMPGLPHEWMEQLGKWIEFESFYNIGLYEPLDACMFRTFKTGTCVLKAPWTEELFYLARPGSNGSESYATEEIKTEGLSVKPIPYDDFFVHPITANNLSEVQVKFHRLRLTKEEVELRKARGWWDKDAVDFFLRVPTDPQKSPARATQAQEAGIQLTQDVARPFQAVEAWFEYDIGDGKNFRIVCVFNPQSALPNSILRLYFNYYTKGIDPFIDFRFASRDDLFYGYSIPEILEQTQEEQSQIHNARRDSNLIANSPGWKKKRYADVPNPSSEWYPGKVFELEDMADLEAIQFGKGYNDMIMEEQFLMQLGERQTGVGPPMQAAGSGGMGGKRGIYSSMGTLAMLSEGNKRLDIFLRRLRYPMHRVGNIIYQSHRDFRPTGSEYTIWGANGETHRKTFAFKEPKDYRGLFFDIGASDSSANREVDRTALLLMANTMAGYYRQIIEASSIITQVPEDHPLRKILLLVLDGAKDLADRLLFTFDVGDRDRLIPDIRKVLGGSSQQADEAAEQSGLPGAEGDLSPEGLQGLSGRLAALPRSGTPSA